MFRTFLLTALAALLLLPSVAFGQEDATPRLEDLVPDHTFLFASVNDVSSMREQASRTAVMKLWQEPEVQQFLAPGMAMIEQQLAMLEKQTGHRLSELCGLLQGQLALAIIEYDPAYGPIPDAVALVDLGSQMESFKKAHAEMMAGVGDQISVSVVEYAGVSYQNVTLPIGLEISVGYLGNALVIASAPERMAGMIDAWKKGLPTSLAKSRTFQAVKRNTGGDGAWLNVFFNMESVLGFFGEQVDSMTMRAMDVLGVREIKALGIGSSFHGEGIRDTFFAYVPGEKVGIMGLMYTSPGDGTKLLSRVPANAFYASAGRVDLHELMGRVLEMLGEVEPGMLEQALAGLGQARDLLGLDIQQDLLLPFGEEMAFYAALPDGGGLIPDIVFMNRLRDPDKFLNSLGKLVLAAQEQMKNDRRVKVDLRSMEFMGKTIHYVHVGHKRGDPVPVMPSLYLDGNLVVMALYPQVLKDHIARGPNAPSILTRPDFARVLKGLPVGMDSLEYMDFNAGMRILYGTLAPIIQLAANDLDCPLDMAYLPRTETIAKHFFGGAWGMDLGEEGPALHSYTPMGLMPLMAVSMLPALFLSNSRASMPAEVIFAKPEPMPEHVKPEIEEPKTVPAAPGRRQLEEIYIGLLFHFAQTDKFPKDLGEMVASRAIEDAASLLLPGDEAPLTTASGQETSFAYVGPKPGFLTKGQESVIWVYERDGRPGGMRWVLFASGDIERITEADFQKLIEASRKAAK